MQFVGSKFIRKTVVFFLLAFVTVGLYGCKCGKDRKYDTLLLGDRYFLDSCLANIGISYTATYNNILPFDVPVQADGVDTEVRLVTLTNNNPSDKGCDLTLASAAMLSANDLHFDGFQDSSGNPLSSPIQFGTGATVVLLIRAGTSTATGLQINTLQVRFDLARTRESGGNLNIDTSAWFVDDTIACSLSSSISPSTYARLVPLDATVTERLGTSFSFVPLDCNNLQYQARVNRESDPPGFLTLVEDPAPASLTTTPVMYKYADFVHSPTFGPPGSTLDAYYIFSVDLAGGIRYFSKKLSGEFSVTTVADPCVAAGVFSRNPTSISMVGNYGDPQSIVAGLISYDGTNPAATPCLNRPYEIRERQVSVSGAPLLTINLPVSPSRVGTLGTSLLNFNFDSVANWPSSGTGQQREDRIVEFVLTDSGAIAAQVPVDAIVGQPIDPCLSAFTISPSSLSLFATLGGAQQFGLVTVNFTPTAACTSTSFNASKVETGVAGNLVSSGQMSGSLSTQTVIPYNATLTPNNLGITTHDWTLTLASGAMLTFSIVGNVTQNPCSGAITAVTSPDPIYATVGGANQFGDVVISNSSVNPACTAIDGTISLQSTTLAGGTVIEVMPYSFTGLQSGQIDRAISLARVAPGGVVESGMLLATISYGLAGSGASTQIATFIVNADIQAAPVPWLDCLTNVLSMTAIPNNSFSATVGDPRDYRSIEFNLAPRCLTGAYVTWLTQTKTGAGATQLVLNSGNISLDPGQIITSNNIVEFIPGSQPTSIVLDTNFTLTPRAVGAPSVNLVGPQFVGTLNPPPASIATCNITSPASGATVFGNIPIAFDAQVPSGTLNYQVDAITSSAPPALATPALGSINPVLGVSGGSFTFNWNSPADGIALSEQQDAVIRVTITDTGSTPYATSCLVHVHVINYNTAANPCRTAPGICGDVDSSGAITITDALLTAQISQGSPIPVDLRCSESGNVVSRCLSADVDKDGVVTGVMPVVPTLATDAGIIATFVVGSLGGPLTCNDEQMILNNSETLPIDCVNTLITRDYCLAVPQSVTASQLQTTGIRLYATDAQFPGPGQGIARFYVRVLRADGVSTTYSLLQLQGLPTPYSVATPSDTTVRSQGLLTAESLLLVVTESGVCGVVHVTP